MLLRTKTCTKNTIIETQTLAKQRKQSGLTVYLQNVSKLQRLISQNFSAKSFKKSVNWYFNIGVKKCINIFPVHKKDNKSDPNNTDQFQLKETQQLRSEPIKMFLTFISKL